MFGFFNNKVFNTGFLPAYEGHTVYYQQMGNPKGEPVIYFHGGPGGSCNIRHGKYFNLKKQRVIMFDQRGCGKSIADDDTSLNDTKRLVKDAKRLLDHLEIKDKITVAGTSWGSTLALLFAEKYPQIVKEICVNAVFLARRSDMEWLLKDSALFYPDLLEEIRRQSEGENPYTHYARLIFTEDLGSIQTAIKYMGQYEHQLGALNPAFRDIRIDTDSIRKNRVYLYYAANLFFLEENEILKNINTIKDIPTFIVHNRLDMCCPLKGAWDLYRSLNNAKIEIVASNTHVSDKMKETVRKHFDHI